MNDECLLAKDNKNIIYKMFFLSFANKHASRYIKSGQNDDIIKKRFEKCWSCTKSKIKFSGHSYDVSAFNLTDN